MRAGVLYEYNRRQNRAQRSADGRVAGRTPNAGDSAKREDGNRVQLPDDVQERIRAYRREYTEHGFKRIAELLRQKYLVVGSCKQIRNELKAAGALLEIRDGSFDRAETSSAKGDTAVRGVEAG